MKLAIHVTAAVGVSGGVSNAKIGLTVASSDVMALFTADSEANELATNAVNSEQEVAALIAAVSSEKYCALII
jgi:hypothetical protein